MPRKKDKGKSDGHPIEYKLPKDFLHRIIVGQPHAEHDRIRNDKNLMVRTPAVLAALDANRSKCFFVGRRGTGKTAITYYLQAERKNTIQVHPEIFNAFGEVLEVEELRNPRNRPFHSLVSCFHRALVCEVFARWINLGIEHYNQLDSVLCSERDLIENHTFDSRLMVYVENILDAIAKHNERGWVKQKARAKEIGKKLEQVHANAKRSEHLLLIDRLDDSWDGSDEAVLLLMALMHACLEVCSEYTFVRPLLFIRENVFERIRAIDSEYSRLRSCVVSLDWTREMLVELVERRIQSSLTTKPPIGEIWDKVFESKNGQSSREMIFDYCQERPRDIITYCTDAIESALAKRRQSVLVEDLLSARRKFSEDRLKDLGDEYSENYPQIQILLGKFYGLTREYTVNAITAIIQKLLTENDVAYLCKEWIYSYTAPHKFIELLYSIGFFGVRTGQSVEFRGLGAQTSSVPVITSSSQLVVHPTYVDALNLRDKVLGAVHEDLILKSEGFLLELPDALDLGEYNSRLDDLLLRIDLIETGNEYDQEYEAIVGDVIKLCFFRDLTNVQSHVRDYEGKVIRDWIASNVSTIGFWHSMKGAYRANQIIWECKNYENLSASDFHQIAYYMNDTIGRFAVLCYRGEMKDSYFPHIKRIAEDRKGLVILLRDKDLKVFVRQARNGKVKDAHIQRIFDETSRRCS